jgi:hypothetical protein
MSDKTGSLWRRLLVIPPVLVGVAILALQLTDAEPPRQAEPAEIPRPVRVIEVAPAVFVPRALGYGYVQPARIWEAVAEVAGKNAAWKPPRRASKRSWPSWRCASRTPRARSRSNAAAWRSRART